MGRGMEGGVQYYSQKLIEVDYSLVVTAWERGHVLVESEKVAYGTYFYSNLWA